MDYRINLSCNQRLKNKRIFYKNLTVRAYIFFTELLVKGNVSKGYFIKRVNLFHNFSLSHGNVSILMEFVSGLNHLCSYKFYVGLVGTVVNYTLWA